jgi:hypothetical protein
MSYCSAEEFEILMRRSGTGRDAKDGIGQKKKHKKKRKSPFVGEEDAGGLQQRQRKSPRLLEKEPAPNTKQERRSSLRPATSTSTKSKSKYKSVSSSTMPKSTPAACKTSTPRKSAKAPREQLVAEERLWQQAVSMRRQVHQDVHPFAGAIL